ncbi:bifunctional diguanylate cyclase/phosphodiesterase [Salinicola avicenniae]|uniref:bifunctional diguanylate cyclase/phosphodiesterase n=1 Tax=Salinicola avicenniae TaxID=2916836 RepID=UPI0020746B4D|nr:MULTISPECIES: EAL domain-containing protein [unclassified Salinicola]
MSLFRRSVAIMVGLLLLFSIGIFAIEVHQTRASLADRQRADVDNLAQALSLSLVPFVEIGDWTSAETLMRAVADGGVVRRIELEAVGRDTPLVVSTERGSDTPAWFQHAIDLPSASGEREISGGWSALGSVRVESESAYAYDQLWSLALQLLLWLVIGMLVVFVLCIVGIKLLLGPLNRLARRISDMQIDGFDAPLPASHVRELRGITESVNRLGERLNQQFDQQAEQVVRLQRLTEQDAVSLLGNRAYLARVLDEWLAAPVGGALVILRIDHLQELYRRDGFEARDHAIRNIGTCLTHMALEGHPVLAARLSAEEFAMILPDCDDAVRDGWLGDTLDRLDDIVDANPLAENRARHTRAGIVLRERGMTREGALARADSALREAIERNQRWVTVSAEDDTAARGRQEWRLVIDRALEAEDVTLVAQPVLLAGGDELHREVYVRLNEGETRHLAYLFLPVVNHFHLGARLDLTVLAQLEKQAGSYAGRLAINLTADSLATPMALQALIRWLETHPRLAARLDLEVSEEVALEHLDAVQQLFRLAHRIGARGGIDRFARQLAAMGYLARLRPDYVKIDQGFFVREDVDREFLRSLCMAAHQVEAKVIVTRVESDEQRQRVEEVGADGYQGYLAPIASLS